MQDVAAVIEALENDVAIVEVMEDGFDVVEVEQDEIGVVKLLEDVQDADVQDEVPDAGLEVLSCSDVLYNVVGVDLDLQDDKLEQSHVHIEEQDVQVEDEDVDKSLEVTLNELAILDVEKEVR